MTLFSQVGTHLWMTCFAVIFWNGKCNNNNCITGQWKHPQSMRARYLEAYWRIEQNAISSNALNDQTREAIFWARSKMHWCDPTTQWARVNYWMALTLKVWETWCSGMAKGSNRVSFAILKLLCGSSAGTNRSSLKKRNILFHLILSRNPEASIVI